MPQQNVSFRRIHGRIVPIKTSNHTKEIAKGAAAISTGIAVSQLGKTAAGLIHEAAHADKQALELSKKFRTMKNAGPLFDHAIGKVGKNALRAAVKAKQLQKAAFYVRHGSTIVAGTLFGYGANKILSQTSLKDSPDAKAAVAGGAAAGATFAVRHAYARGLGNKGFSAIKIALKKVATKGFRA